MEDQRAPMAYEEDEYAMLDVFMQTALEWARMFSDNPPQCPEEVLTWLDPQFDGLHWVPYEGDKNG